MYIIDFETYSPIPIEDGIMKYLSHPDADIVMYADKYGINETLIHSPNEIPSLPDAKIYAHNAAFDYLVWHLIGCRKYGYPVVPLECWHDTMALCNRYSLPSGLDKAGAVLSIPIEKQKNGKKLINLICVPTNYGTRPVLGQDFTATALAEFASYCKDDVNATYGLLQALPAVALSEDEQAIWRLTFDMNAHGLPVDIKSAEKIFHYIAAYAEDLTIRVPELTDGRVDKVTQTKRLQKFINEVLVKAGIPEMPNFQAPTVEKLLERDGLPVLVQELLELRQMLGRSSAAKFKRIVEMTYNGRIHFNLHYYGAATGRWAGRGFQLHNLPRATVADPEDYIRQFNNFEPVENPVNIAKALIRSMVMAPYNHMLLVSDYSSVENRVLAWLAEDENELDGFRNNGDQYIEMAAFLYGVLPQNVTKAQRQVGKIIILGCGFGLGGGGLQETAEGWGVYLTDHESAAAVAAYRKKFALVVKLWYGLKEIVVQAIRRPNENFKYKKINARVTKDNRGGNTWLVLTLPSGRNLYYMDPYLEQSSYGAQPGHYGVNPYTKTWSRLKLIPGRITENCVQGTARDILAFGCLELKKRMPYVTQLGTVHDENISMLHERHITDTTIEEFNNALCSPGLWATGLPLKAEGFIAKRYKK